MAARILFGCRTVGWSPVARTARPRPSGRPGFRVRCPLGHRFGPARALAAGIRRIHGLFYASADGAAAEAGVAHRPPPAEVQHALGLRRERRKSSRGEHSRQSEHRRSPAIVAMCQAAARGGGGDDAGVLAPERRLRYLPGHHLGHWRMCSQPYRPPVASLPVASLPVASLQLWFDPLPLLLANLPPAGDAGDVAGVGDAAAGLRRPAMTGRPDRRRPGCPRRLRPAFRALHSMWERWADRRKNAASGRFLDRRFDFG